MSTHCNVFVEQDDGTLTGTYCHFDGYIDGGVGEELTKMSWAAVLTIVKHAQRVGGFRTIAGGVTYLSDKEGLVLSSLDNSPCHVQYTYVKCKDGSLDVVMDGHRFKAIKREEKGSAEDIYNLLSSSSCSSLCMDNPTDRHMLAELLAEHLKG